MVIVVDALTSLAPFGTQFILRNIISPLVVVVKSMFIDASNPKSTSAGCRWYSELGMVNAHCTIFENEEEYRETIPPIDRLLISQLHIASTQSRFQSIELLW